MDERTRERLERQHRPHLFEDCLGCGKGSVKKGSHVCDPVRRETYFHSFTPPPVTPNAEMIHFLEQKLLEVFKKHRMVITSEQLRDFALAMEPSTRGGYAMGANG